jgi:hypothetical protein
MLPCFVENKVEVSYAMEHGVAVSCEFASVATQQENKPCSEYQDEEVCLADGEIDWPILDASLRPDLCRPLRT